MSFASATKLMARDQKESINSYARPAKTKRGGGKKRNSNPPSATALSQKIDLDKPMSADEKAARKSEHDLYVEYNKQLADHLAKLDMHPNRYDTGNDYMMRVFFGNSTTFLVHELRCIQEALAAQYSGQDAIDAAQARGEILTGPPIPQCSVSNEELAIAQKRFQRVIDNIAIARDQAKFLIMSMLGQLHKVHARVCAHSDRVRFEVFTRWLRPALDDLIHRRTSVELPQGRFPDLHRFVQEAALAYVLTPDAHGAINQQLSQQHKQTAPVSASST